MIEQKSFLEEIKLSYQLLQYSIKWKMQLIATGIFVAVAILNMIVMGFSDTSTVISGIYLAISPMMLSQMLMILTYAGMVQSSVYKKKLQCDLFAAQFLVSEIVLYTAALLLMVLFLAIGFYDNATVARVVLPLVGFALCITWTYPVFYKMNLAWYFFVVVVLCVAIGAGVQVAAIRADGALSRLFALASAPPAWLVLFMPYPVFFFNAFVMVKVSRALYRRPIAGWFVNQSFRQAK